MGKKFSKDLYIIFQPVKRILPLEERIPLENSPLHAFVNFSWRRERREREREENNWNKRMEEKSHATDTCA